MKFEFASAQRILFGQGVLSEAGKIAAALGKSALVVTGNSPERAQNLLDLLRASGLSWLVFKVQGEPSVDSARAGAELARSMQCDLVIGLGGGSVLDTAKAVAALAANPEDPYEYLEVVGQGRPLQFPPLPWIGIPTTAGTGSEVTRNAVLAVPEPRVKVSLRSPQMLARAAIIDPNLTRSLPPDITASSGMDALAQVLEPFVSTRANPLTNGFCREGLSNAAWALRRAYLDGGDMEAREAMSLVSLLGGLALANAGLGAAHGFAGPIGGMFPAPHGAVCAVLLPAVVSVNLRAIRSRQPDSPVIDRYTEAARLLTGNPSARAEDCSEWLLQLSSDLGIPRLSRYGIQADDIPLLVTKAMSASSMQANPVRLEPEELSSILEMAV